VCSPDGEVEAAVKAELGEEAGLVEEDLVAVSYMGDELDLETVGDIIAIIEEKVGPGRWWLLLWFHCPTRSVFALCSGITA